MSFVAQYFTSIPILFSIQISAIYFAAKRATSQGQSVSISWISVMLALLVTWGILTTYLGATGQYLRQDFLSAYPTFWLPFIPVVLVMIPISLFRSARTAVRELIDATPITWIVGIHMLRILAIGTLIKMLQGEFSVAFQMWVGLPDLAFGLSAVVMFLLARKGRVSRLGLLLWNFVGILVILPGAPIVAQRELPGVFYVAEQVPPMTTLYEFPMVLAPSLVVPIFVMINLFVAIRQIERMLIKQPAIQGVSRT